MNGPEEKVGETERIMHLIINAGIRHWCEMWNIKEVFDSIDGAKKTIMDENDSPDE